MCRSNFKRNWFTGTALLFIAVCFRPIHGRFDAKIADGMSGGFKRCQKIMMNSGIDVVNFPFATAHRLHSIRLHELRFWFDPNAPVKNGIPTINADLRSDSLITENVIDEPSPFTSPSMKGIDSVLNHATDLHYEIAKGTIQDSHLPLLLFRIIHQGHMSDLWAMMKPVYDDLVKNPPKDRNLCPCVKDHNNNGYMDSMKMMSQTKGSALIGDPDAEYVEGDVESYNLKAIQDYWPQLRNTFLEFYDDNLEVDTYGAAMFVYCKLKE